MNDPVDPERPRDPKPFDRPDGYSGQGYTVEREAAEGAQAPAPLPERAEGRDIPPDVGVRATIDERTGEVHGSGAGAGGGNPGEDFDTASTSGDSYPLTGGEGTDHAPGDLGPKNEEASYL